MRLSRERLLAEAGTVGFRAELVEKVVRLLSLLEGLRSHPFLKGRLALKGGTALNLFVFDLPRLSVDVDLNYIGAAGLEEMQAERPRVEQAVQAVCAREELQVRRQPGEHAGGKWRLRYASALGEGGSLELDLNYMFRVPLWPVTASDSRPVGSFRATGVPMLDVHELAAGKLAALLSRRAARDLFDAHTLLARGGLDAGKLRLAFVLYGAMNRRDWRTVQAEDVAFEAREIETQLLPVLRGGPDGAVEEPRAWAAGLAAECRRELGIVLPLNDGERAFLDRLLDRGEVEPDGLTSDPEMAGRIRAHPLLQWKALNVRQHTHPDR